MIMIIIAMRSGDTSAENLKARHCSHCFQYYLASRVLAFFYLFFAQEKMGQNVARSGGRSECEVTCQFVVGFAA